MYKHRLYASVSIYRDSKSKEKSVSKSKNSRLAPDPKPAPPPAEPTSAINVVILFDVTDTMCLKRSAGRYGTQSIYKLMVSSYSL